MKTILIADDESGVRMIVSAVAQYAGFNPLEAASGKEALELSDQADVYMLDTDMEELNIGIAVLKEVKKRFPGKPVIMMTGNLSKEREKAYQDAGADYYFQKPISNDNLEKIMGNYK